MTNVNNEKKEIIISDAEENNIKEPEVKINIPDLDTFTTEQLVLLHEALKWLTKDVEQRISTKKEA